MDSHELLYTEAVDLNAYLDGGLADAGVTYQIPEIYAHLASVNAAGLVTPLAEPEGKIGGVIVNILSAATSKKLGKAILKIRSGAAQNLEIALVVLDLDLTGPVVSGLNAVWSSNNIVVTWTDISDPDGTAVASASLTVVSQDETDNLTPSPIDALADGDKSVTLARTKNGKTYDVEIQSVNVEGGTSITSVQVAVPALDTTPPVINNLVASYDNVGHDLYITWDPITDPDGTAITASTLTVKSQDNAHTPVNNVNVLGQTSRTTNDLVGQHKLYNVTLTATNADGAQATATTTVFIPDWTDPVVDADLTWNSGTDNLAIVYSLNDAQTGLTATHLKTWRDNVLVDNYTPAEGNSQTRNLTVSEDVTKPIYVDTEVYAENDASLDATWIGGATLPGGAVVNPPTMGAGPFTWEVVANLDTPFSTGFDVAVDADDNIFFHGSDGLRKLTGTNTSVLVHPWYLSNTYPIHSAIARDWASNVIWGHSYSGLYFYRYDNQTGRAAITLWGNTTEKLGLAMRNLPNGEIVFGGGNSKEVRTYNTYTQAISAPLFDLDTTGLLLGSNTRITDLEIDANGTIWISTGNATGGVRSQLFKRETNGNISLVWSSPVHGTNGDYIERIAIDGAGRVIMASRGSSGNLRGVLVGDDATNATFTFYATPGPGNPDCYGVCLDNDGHIIVSTGPLSSVGRILRLRTS